MYYDTLHPNIYLCRLCYIFIVIVPKKQKLVVKLQTKTRTHYLFDAFRIMQCICIYACVCVGTWVRACVCVQDDFLVSGHKVLKIVLHWIIPFPMQWSCQMGQQLHGLFNSLSFKQKETKTSQLTHWGQDKMILSHFADYTFIFKWKC